MFLYTIPLLPPTKTIHRIVKLVISYIYIYIHTRSYPSLPIRNRVDPFEKNIREKYMYNATRMCKADDK